MKGLRVMTNYKDKYPINILNNIGSALGSETEKAYPIDTLNEISKALGGTGESKYPADALDEIAKMSKVAATRIVRGAGCAKLEGTGLNNVIEYRPPEMSLDAYGASKYIIVYGNTWDSLTQKTSYIANIKPCFKYIVGNKYHMLVPIKTNQVYDSKTKKVNYTTCGYLYEIENGGKTLTPISDFCSMSLELMYDGDDPIDITWESVLESDYIGVRIPVKLRLVIVDGDKAGTEYDIDSFTVPVPSFNYVESAVDPANWKSMLYIQGGLKNVTYFSHSRSATVYPKTNVDKVTLVKGTVIGQAMLGSVATFTIDDDINN